jgi:hypothetical protein
MLTVAMFNALSTWALLLLASPAFSQTGSLTFPQNAEETINASISEGEQNGV